MDRLNDCDMVWHVITKSFALIVCTPREGLPRNGNIYSVRSAAITWTYKQSLVDAKCRRDARRFILFVYACMIKVTIAYR